MATRFDRLVNPSQILLRQLAELYALCFNQSEWQENWTTESALEVIESYLAEQADLFIAIDGDQPVGIGVGVPVSHYHGRQELLDANVPEQAYWLADLAVHPDKRCCGIGAALVRCRIGRAKELGAECVATRTLETCAAFTVLTGTGFQKIGEATFVTGGKPSVRAILVLELR